LLGAYRVGGAEATFDRWSPLGAVLPTKWTGSLPPTALGVMTHVPPQAPRATLAPVFNDHVREPASDRAEDAEARLHGRVDERAEGAPGAARHCLTVISPSHHRQSEQRDGKSDRHRAFHRVILL
jgi:hypothetical protein